MWKSPAPVNDAVGGVCDEWTPLLNGESNRDKRQQSKVASGVNVFVVDSCSCVSGNVTVRVTVTVHDVPSKTSMFF